MKNIWTFQVFLKLPTLGLKSLFTPVVIVIYTVGVKILLCPSVIYDPLLGLFGDASLKWMLISLEITKSPAQLKHFKDWFLHCFCTISEITTFLQSGSEIFENVQFLFRMGCLKKSWMTKFRNYTKWLLVWREAFLPKMHFLPMLLYFYNEEI